MLSIFSACKDRDEYRIDNAFTEYLQRFESEAENRGRNFDFESTGLIIEFTELKNNNAGLTHYENPIRIEIDKSYWNAISKTAGADLMKEDLIFHELGHGILKRNHLNSTLENGDWKSMMCGGTKVDNRSWNINYRADRRQYYINELFDESTATPSFSTLTLSKDTSGFEYNSFLSFNTIKQADTGWGLKDLTNYKSSVEFENGNGRLKLESKINEVLLVLATFSNEIDIQSNFALEMSIQYKVGDDSNQYGLVFGHTKSVFDGVNDSIEYFTINNSKNMYMGNRTWYSYYTELYKNVIKPNSSNKLKIFKIDNTIYYFINNEYCYSSEIELSGNINNIGFFVPSNATVLIDNFGISSLGTSRSMAPKLNQMKSIDFKVIQIKNDQKNILNR